MSKTKGKAKAKAKDIRAAVREICLSFPQTEETSHFMPDFKVLGKTFGTYAMNHHGDGRVALWLKMPEGAQQMYAEGEPDYYFVPPYVGTKGWLGVYLDRDNDWRTIAARAREAYEHVAPAYLAETLGDTIVIEPPTETVDPEEMDPLSAPHAREKLEQLRAFAATLPETSEAKQFGTPCWKCGKKTFLVAYRKRGVMRLEFWVGNEAQLALTADPRFVVPRYIGHRGWIDLNVEDSLDWDEVRELILGSYRHFALKRMLKALDEQEAGPLV